ncbi:MAG: hypothetical protein RLZZ21_2441 [Planctomycetota bacterium]
MEIPENVRQTLGVIAKYHFWILATLVPAIALTVLWIGNSALTVRIKQQRQKIQSTLGQISSVTSVSPHPNAEWAKVIDGESTKISAETLAEWQQLWESQADLRTWPDDLGVDDFLPAAATVAPGGRLERKYLLRYQKFVPRFARSLPVRLGVKDEMVEAATPAGRQPDRPDAMAAAALIETTWNAADQKKLYDSFVWDAPPTTTQVLVAQEELWVYGALCDVIGQFNARKKAQGSRELPIAMIDELAVGYRAAKDALAAAEAKRIVIPAGAPEAAVGGPVDADGFAIAPAPGDAPPDDPMAAGGTGEAVVNPRFESGAKAASEDSYRNLIYVDFAGKPLTAAQLGTVPDARMVHLVPFVFKGVIDQRELDGLLVALASANLPIDVREVRINPGAGGAAAGSASAPPAGAGAGRRYDVRVELRGTVALATAPDEAALGSAPAAAMEEGA